MGDSMLKRMLRSPKKSRASSDLHEQYAAELRRQNAYCRFFIENRAKVAAQYPNLKANEVVKMTSMLWNTLPLAEKEPHERKIREQRIAIHRRYLTYDLPSEMAKHVVKKLRTELRLLHGKSTGSRRKRKSACSTQEMSCLKAEEQPSTPLSLFPTEKPPKLQPAVMSIKPEATLDDECSSTDEEGDYEWNYSKLVAISENETANKNLEDDDDIKALQVDDCAWNDTLTHPNTSRAFTKEFLALDTKLEEEFRKLKVKKSWMDKKLEDSLASLKSSKQVLLQNRSNLSAFDQQIDVAAVWVDYLYRSNVVAALNGLRNPSFLASPNTSNIIDYLRAAREVVKENKPGHRRFVNRFNEIMANLDMPSLDFSFLKNNVS